MPTKVTKSTFTEPQDMDRFDIDTSIHTEIEKNSKRTKSKIGMMKKHPDGQQRTLGILSPDDSENMSLLSKELTP